MGKFICCSLTFFMLLCGLCVAAQATDSRHVVWLGFDYPPYYIPHGEFAGSGIHDTARNLFIKALPQYQHTIRTVNTTRLIKTFKSTDQTTIYCVPGSAPIPGLTHMIYTDAMYHTAPEGLVVHEDSPLYAGGTTISLKETLAQKHYKIGYLKASSVSPMVLELLQEYPTSTKTILQTAPLKSLRMLEVHDIHGVIHFPLTYKSMIKRHPRFSSFRFMKIREQGQFGYPISAYCMDNNAGRQFVKQLNKIIAKPGFRPVLEQRLRDFL